jgi:hypothetical protein
MQSFKITLSKFPNLLQRRLQNKLPSMMNRLRRSEKRKKRKQQSLPSQKNNTNRRLLILELIPISKKKIKKNYFRPTKKSGNLTLKNGLKTTNLAFQLKTSWSYTTARLKNKERRPKREERKAKVNRAQMILARM